MSNEDFKIMEKTLLTEHLFFEDCIFKANNKYLGITENIYYKSYIQFYNLEAIENINDKYFILKIKFILFELNQKFQYVLLISNKNFIELYELPKNFDKLAKEINPKIKYKIDELTINQISFNPRYSHIIAFLAENSLFIWDNQKFYNSNNYNFKNPLRKLKWQKSGNLCGFFEENNLKIINRNEKCEIFSYKCCYNEFYDFDFIDENSIIIVKRKKIKIISLIDKNITEKEIPLNFTIDKVLLKTDTFLILKSQQDLLFYDNDFKLAGKITILLNLMNSIVLSFVSEEIKLIALESKYIKLITISEEDNQEKYQNFPNNNIKNIENENENKNEIILFDEEDNLNDYYFNGCIPDMTDIFSLLKNDNNEDNSLPNRINKKYFEIDLIKESLKNQSKSLIDLKNIVNKEMKKTRLFNNVDEEYLYYIKLLIKDDTNIALLKKYLHFIKNIDKNIIKIKYPYEKFKDELNYYLPLLNENELIEFEYKNFKSEKQEVEKLLKDIKNNIEKGKFKEFQDSLDNVDFIYYQPFPLDSQEIMFLRYKMSIIEDVKNFEFNELEKKNRLNYLNHIIGKILDNKILEKVKTPQKLIPLFNFISEKEDIQIFDFYFNLINYDENKENNKILSSNECPENIELSKNSYRNYDQSELKNYNYLIEHPPLRIDIKKMKEFLSEVLNLNVFSELFSFLTGSNDYTKIFNPNMINYIIDNINFMPLNYTNTSAFFDKLTFTTYVNTMRKILFINIENADIKIYQTLENGCIIEIIFHEFCHVISSIFSFLYKNRNIISTPRKKFKI